MKQFPQRIDIDGGSISEKARQWLYSFQEGKCAICGASKNLNPDYDIKSGELRGLICKECNLNIGRIERRGSVSIKDPNYNQIKDYLNNHTAKRAKLMRIVPLKKFIIEKNLEKTTPGEYVLSLPEYLEPNEHIDLLPEVFHRADALK